MVKKIFENNMKLEMDSVSENESLARMGVASFLTKIDPTLEEINDIKTAVSEAVTNSIIHGYRDKKGIVEIKCHLREIMDAITLIKQAHAGDKMARDKLILENTGLIWSIVKRFTNRGYEAEDLFQIGCIGLIKSVDNFDMQYDVKFSTYAVPMIAGEIKRFLRDDGLIKVSRALKELAYKAYQENERIKNELGRDATISELASKLEVSEEEISMAIDSSMEVESLHQTIYQNDGNEIYLMDKLKNEEGCEEEAINKVMISQILNEMTDNERRLIKMRYFSNMSQKDVGEQLGISQVQVSRLEKRILTKARLERQS